MTVRIPRLVGLVATGALVAGAAVIPQVGTALASTNDPAFYEVSADSVAPHDGDKAFARSTTARSTAVRAGANQAKVKKAKSVQVLQVIHGIEGAGANGLAVAAGPKHVVELAGQTARAYEKSTGAQAATATTNKFFGIPATTVLTQPTIAYDPVRKRFVAVAVTNDGGDVGLAMRISKSSAAVPFNKKKWLKPVTLASGDAFDEAQPRVGISANKIAITATTDTPATPNRLFFLPRNQYYQGSDPGAWAADVDATYDGQAPAVNQTKQKNLFIAVPSASDVSLTTYAGAAINHPPTFSMSVVYPTTNLTAPPTVIPTAGDTIDLGGLAFDSVAWRDNKLWGASTGNCSGFACIRVVGLKTKGGVSLVADETLKRSGRDYFSPGLAVDGHGTVQVGVTAVGATGTGPAQVVFARKGSNSWTKLRYIRKGTSGADGPGGTMDWWASNSAAADPTSPHDVWIGGASGDSHVPGSHLTTRVARVSLAKNVATLQVKGAKPAKDHAGHRGHEGKSVTMIVKLTRPGGAAIKGQPVAVQSKRTKGGHWTTVNSGKTSKTGRATWTVKVNGRALYRAYGKAVSPEGNKTLAYDKVYGHSVSVSLK